MKSFGVTLLIGGLVVAAFALLGFDTTVAGHDGGRIHNIGLLQDRQNLLIASCVAAIIGAILTVAGKSESRPSTESPSPATEAANDPAVEQMHQALRAHDVATVDNLLHTKQVRSYGELGTGRGYLQYAIMARQKPLIEVLLKHGAPISHRDTLGKSALELAENSIDPEIARLVNKAAPGPTPVAAPAVTLERPHAVLIADQIIKLAELLDRGLLTPEEFTSQKAALLAARSLPSGASHSAG